MGRGAYRSATDGALERVASRGLSASSRMLARVHLPICQSIGSTMTATMSRGTVAGPQPPNSGRTKVPRAVNQRPAEAGLFFEGAMSRSDLRRLQRLLAIL